MVRLALASRIASRSAAEPAPARARTSVSVTVSTPVPDGLELALQQRLREDVQSSRAVEEATPGRPRNSH